MASLLLALLQVAILGATAYVLATSWADVCVWFADRGEPVEGRPS